ncbi:hypothetical protein PUR61_09250 [Streptomyces sp. BE20]|uniref:hypothetical protein n=1 Tax=Streptomyces sp. BE20 TaxID=3002525 RepID=UPI002E78B938|nr:hypothetical protein [Streptomyces sp. BE20]MEE1822378.1 hypothetical protein [Streptomyces sp. BE20]
MGVLLCCCFCVFCFFFFVFFFFFFFFVFCFSGLLGAWVAAAEWPFWAGARPYQSAARTAYPSARWQPAAPSRSLAQRES